jgi:cysteine-rich PDZ-binding protein
VVKRAGDNARTEDFPAAIELRDRRLMFRTWFCLEKAIVLRSARFRQERRPSRRACFPALHEHEQQLSNHTQHTTKQNTLVTIFIFVLCAFLVCAAVSTDPLGLKSESVRKRILTDCTIFGDMVCDSCQTKVTRVCVPDKWKEGARNTIVAGGKAKPGKTNKLLAAQQVGAQWLPQETKCRLCKSKVQANMFYCNDCAHKKGICTMCGKKVVATEQYNMSLT